MKPTPFDSPVKDSLHLLISYYITVLLFRSQTEEQNVSQTRGLVLLGVYDRLACDIVAEDPGCDDVAARREYPLEVGLSHVLGEAAHVQVRPLYGLAARPRV